MFAINKVDDVKDSDELMRTWRKLSKPRKLSKSKNQCKLGN